VYGVLVPDGEILLFPTTCGQESKQAEFLVIFIFILVEVDLMFCSVLLCPGCVKERGESEK
jgi:hypothetical protein